MTVLSVDYPRDIAGGITARLSLEAAANPYQGSALSRDILGYVHELVAGEPFAGFCTRAVPTAEAPVSSGDCEVDAVIGLFTAVLPLAVGRDDIAHRRLVYATDDATFVMTGGAATSTLIGCVIGYVNATYALVLCATAGYQGALNSNRGSRTLAATGNQTLTTEDMDKLLIVPNTAALTLTLPLAADCLNRRVRILKSTAAGGGTAVTIDGNGDETINGAANNATIDAQWDLLELEAVSATEWLIVGNSVS